MNRGHRYEIQQKLDQYNPQIVAVKIEYAINIKLINYLIKSHRMPSTFFF